VVFFHEAVTISTLAGAEGLLGVVLLFVIGTVGVRGGSGISALGVGTGSASSIMVANFLRTCLSAGRRMGLLGNMC
jgi:hypothetical protein